MHVVKLHTHVFLFRVVMSAAIPALNDVRFVYTLVCYGEVYCFIYTGAPEGLAVPAPLVALVVLLLCEMNIIWYGNCDGRHMHIRS
jgi:hypothetical protein